MTTIQRNKNIVVFWNEMSVFNPEYYYYMLTEKQKRLVEFDVIRKTLTYYEKRMIAYDMLHKRNLIYNTAFPVLTQYVIPPIASIIYDYYTINKDQIMLS
jgi:hypothetical protein